MSLADELKKLRELHESGAINDEEFALAKARLLRGEPEAQPGATEQREGTALSPTVQEQQTRQWGMFLHLSVLAGFVVPIAGLVAPILIWQLKKDELPGIDVHGKNAVNWIISEIIYAVVCFILVFVIIGIPLLIALFVVGVIFPIIAAVKANDGKVWRYPLAIPFLNGGRPAVGEGRTGGRNRPYGSLAHLSMARRRLVRRGGHGL